MKMIKTEPYVPNEKHITLIDANRASISVSPFEAGYAITFAHPLRRLLLSSSVGYSVIALKIEGVTHEFDSIRGITEDVSQFITHLKHMRFKIKDVGLDEVKLDYSFRGRIVLNGVSLSNNVVEVVNADTYLATINEGYELSFSLIIKKGIGYVPSEDIRPEIEEGYIPLDAYFTPVKRAVYDISNVLLEDNPNFEKLVFEIETDGQISPIDAFNDAVSFMYKQLNVFDIKNTELSEKKDNEESSKILLELISNLYLSARSTNCLEKSGLKLIGELVMMKESDIKNIKSMGKKSFDEISDKLQELGYAFGMSLSESLVNKIRTKASKLK